MELCDSTPDYATAAAGGGNTMPAPFFHSKQEYITGSHRETSSFLGGEACRGVSSAAAGRLLSSK
jgi:hypothetical protein